MYSILFLQVLKANQHIQWRWWHWMTNTSSAVVCRLRDYSIWFTYDSFYWLQYVYLLCNHWKWIHFLALPFFQDGVVPICEYFIYGFTNLFCWCIVVYDTYKIYIYTWVRMIIFFSVLITQSCIPVVLHDLQLSFKCIKLHVNMVYHCTKLFLWNHVVDNKKLYA